MATESKSKNPLDLIVYKPGDMVTRENVDLVKSLICKDASDEQLAGFILTCNQNGLNPFKKQIYAIPFKHQGKDGKWITEYGSVTGIGGYRALAERSLQYAGQDLPQWCGEDGVWKDLWFGPKPPAAARVAVYRKGISRPTYGIALWSECAKVGQDGKPTGFWASMGAKMLAKCAEADGLKKACPDAIGDLGFAADEPDQIIDITPRESTPESRARAVDDIGRIFPDPPDTGRKPRGPVIEGKARIVDDNASVVHAAPSQPVSPPSGQGAADNVPPSQRPGRGCQDCGIIIEDEHVDTGGKHRIYRAENIIKVAEDRYGVALCRSCFSVREKAK